MKLLRLHLTRMAAAIRFFTRIPLPGGNIMTPEEFGRSLVWAPLAGLLVGVWIAGWDLLLRTLLPVAPAAVLTLLVYVAITGGLHLDGLGDTFDGILSGRDRDRMLAIMKDSRIGSFGMLAVWFVLALNTVSLATFPPEGRFAVLCLWPMLGRLMSVAGAALYPYARPEGGLGKSFCETCHRGHLAVALSFTLGVSLLIPGWLGPLWVLSLFGLGAFMLWRMTKPLGGVTGDVLGAALEATQALALPVLMIWMQLPTWIPMLAR